MLFISIKKTFLLLTFSFIVTFPQTKREANKSKKVIKKQKKKKYREIVVNTSGIKAGNFTMSYKAALEYAKKKNKLILLYFTGSDWNDYCIYVTKKIFSNDDWYFLSKEYLATVYIDFPRYYKKREGISGNTLEVNQSLLDKYNISNFPNILLLDKDLKLLKSFSFIKEKDVESFRNEIIILYFLSNKPKGLKNESLEEFNILKKNYLEAEQKLYINVKGKTVDYDFLKTLNQKKSMVMKRMVSFLKKNKIIK